MPNPFRYFNSSPEGIRLVVMMYVKYPLSLRNVEDLLFERGIDVCHETVRLWWNRFGPMFAAEIRRKRVQHKVERVRGDYCPRNVLPPARPKRPENRDPMGLIEAHTASITRPIMLRTIGQR